MSDQVTQTATQTNWAEVADKAVQHLANGADKILADAAKAATTVGGAMEKHSHLLAN